MDKKEYLKQALHLETLIQCNQAELQQLKELSTCIKTVDYEKVSVMESGGSQQASFTKTVEKILELEQVIQKDSQELLEVKSNIRNKLESVQNITERIVLQSKYVLGDSYEVIASKLNLSISSVKRIHNTGINQLNFKS